jgi:hypothetical protein
MLDIKTIYLDEIHSKSRDLSEPTPGIMPLLPNQAGRRGGPRPGRPPAGGPPNHAQGQRDELPEVATDRQE